MVTVKQARFRPPHSSSELSVERCPVASSEITTGSETGLIACAQPRTRRAESQLHTLALPAEPEPIRCTHLNVSGLSHISVPIFHPQESAMPLTSSPNPVHRSDPHHVPQRCPRRIRTWRRAVGHFRGKLLNGCLRSLLHCCSRLTRGCARAHPFSGAQVGHTNSLHRPSQRSQSFGLRHRAGGGPRGPSRCDV